MWGIVKNLFGLKASSAAAANVAAASRAASAVAVASLTATLIDVPAALASILSRSSANIFSFATSFDFKFNFHFNLQSSCRRDGAERKSFFVAEKPKLFRSAFFRKKKQKTKT